MATPEEFEKYEYDVLIIGAGGAGLRAAIEAAAQGVSVGLVCKARDAVDRRLCRVEVA